MGDLKFRLYGGLIFSFLFYTLFVYTQPVNSTSGNLSKIMTGKMIWQQKNCVACHQIYGLGGFLGPDLTNVYSSQGKGPAYIKAFIEGGTSVMPPFHLQEQEMNALLAFFQHIDASGKADPKKFKINSNGTIEGK